MARFHQERGVVEAEDEALHSPERPGGRSYVVGAPGANLTSACHGKTASGWKKRPRGVYSRMKVTEAPSTVLPVGAIRHASRRNGSPRAIGTPRNRGRLTPLVSEETPTMRWSWG